MATEDQPQDTREARIREKQIALDTALISNQQPADPSVPDGATLTDEDMSNAINAGPFAKAITWRVADAATKKAVPYIRETEVAKLQAKLDSKEYSYKRHRDQDDNVILKLTKQRDAALEQVWALVAGFQRIRDNYGHVCSNYALCAHACCRDSYNAWAEATQQLAAMGIH